MCVVKVLGFVNLTFLAPVCLVAPDADYEEGMNSDGFFRTRRYKPCEWRTEPCAVSVDK